MKNFEKETWVDFEKEIYGKKVLLFGASNGGLKFFRDYGVKYTVAEIYDNDMNKWGILFEGIEVKNPELVKRWDVNEIVVLITSTSIAEIYNQLLNWNIKNIFSFLFLRRQGLNWDIMDCDMINLEKLEAILYDRKSKKILKELIYHRQNALINYIDIKEKNQYFDEKIMIPEEREVFVDGGAFNGDTIDRFIRWVKHGNYTIYAIEPDKDNYLQLVHSYLGDERVCPLNIGLWSKREKLKFTGKQGTDNAISETGKFLISCDAIDNVVKEKVTFIKMDIEGSELEALDGARKTIINDRPKLAICIYHKRDDLWRIPLFIHKMVPEYRFYIRHYNSDMSETVIYATM